MKKLLPILLLIIVSRSAMAQLEYANGIANTVMNNYRDSMVVKKFLNHLIQDNQIKPG